MPVVDYYTTRRAAELSGLSTTMIDYLCRAKILTPSRQGSKGRGRGRSRRYSFGDVVLMKTYAKLLKAGVSVKRIKEAKKNWSRHFNTLDRGTLPTRFLLTDGQRVYFQEAEDILEDLNSGGQLAFSFIVDLHQIRKEVLYALGSK